LPPEAARQRHPSSAFVVYAAYHTAYNLEKIRESKVGQNHGLLGESVHLPA
jgi:hypothetical protein